MKVDNKHEQSYLNKNNFILYSILLLKEACVIIIIIILIFREELPINVLNLKEDV